MYIKNIYIYKIYIKYVYARLKINNMKVQITLSLRSERQIETSMDRKQ